MGSVQWVWLPWRGGRGWDPQARPGVWWARLPINDEQTSNRVKKCLYLNEIFLLLYRDGICLFVIVNDLINFIDDIHWEV